MSELKMPRRVQAYPQNCKGANILKVEFFTVYFFYNYGIGTFAVRLSNLAWDPPRFQDLGPYLHNFDRNIHEKYVDMILYI